MLYSIGWDLIENKVIDDSGNILRLPSYKFVEEIVFNAPVSPKERKAQARAHHASSVMMESWKT